MTDLLIRNIDPKLKRRLETRARRSGRSLSEEAKSLLGRALAESPPPTRGLGTALVELFRSAPVELDIERREMPRRPPDFE
ncbi:MAG: FitA-like ribbon-helix-helix domain-containing protein [Methyloceanibacter sp.]|uniref:FitA-like ribbon-helix-helix domain-containing protein n=1 Tax=Methyloceanibacter sp. TaxID=1965321 RepID=UPI003D6C8314